MSGPPFVCVFGSVLYFFRGGIQAEANNCPVDVAALHLDGGTTCGSHKATQVFLEGFEKHLDDSGLQLDPSKCEHFLAKPCLPPFIRWRSRWRRQFAMTNALRCRGAAMGRPSVVTGDRPRFPSVVLRLVSHQLPRAQCLRTPSTSARRGRGPPSKSAWEASPSSPSLKCRGVACPTPSGFPSLQQQHGSPLHQLVEHLQHHARSRRGRRWRPVSLLHSRRSGLPGVRHATSVTCQNAHTLDTLMSQASQEDQTSIKLRQVPGAEPGQWRARLLLFECDADLIRTALQHRLCTHFLAQDTQSRVWPGSRLLPTQRCARARATRTAPHVFYEAAQEAGIRPQKKEQGSSSHAQTSTDFARGPAPNLPPTCKLGISRTLLPPGVPTLARGRLVISSSTSCRI